MTKRGDSRYLVIVHIWNLYLINSDSSNFTKKIWTMSTSGVSKVYHGFEDMELDDGLCGVPHCRNKATEFCYRCVKNLCAEHALESVLAVCIKCRSSYCITSVPEGIECINEHECWTEEDTYQVDYAFLDFLDKMERENKLKKQAEQYIDIESSVDDDMELSEHKEEDYGDLDDFIANSDDGI